jgi:hypothetical protein
MYILKATNKYLNASHGKIQLDAGKLHQIQLKCQNFIHIATTRNIGTILRKHTI